MLVGAAIGGPLALAYYLAKTLRALGRSNLAIGLGIALPLGLLVLVFASAVIPGLDNIPDPFWYLSQFGILVGFTRGYIFTSFKAYLAEGKPIYSWGNTLLVAVVSMAISLALIAAFYIIVSNIYIEMPKVTYGKLEHEIYYDPATIKKPELDRLAKALTETNFFDEEVKKSIQVSRSNNTYIIAIFFSPDANRPDVIAPYRELRTELQKDFPVNKIVIDMVVDTAENRFARLE
ncbi:MAG: hypothetical protein QM785_15275 [Pyrinomonadaceae bacterium]